MQKILGILSDNFQSMSKSRRNFELSLRPVFAIELLSWYLKGIWKFFVCLSKYLISLTKYSKYFSFFFLHFAALSPIFLSCQILFFSLNTLQTFGIRLRCKRINSFFHLFTTITIWSQSRTTISLLANFVHTFFSLHNANILHIPLLYI